MTERIIHLALEIICLVTGERFPPAKSGDHVTIKVSPSPSLTPEKNKGQKILEVTKKIIKLLTGEVDPSVRRRKFLQMDPSVRRRKFLQMDPSVRRRKLLQMDPSVRRRKLLQMDPSLRRRMEENVSTDGSKAV
ncbi:unnamed protein product [Staurois parvus]|uniref:Uncharacterized protein n=1 Tax=Staurois parvus TaxID=386267 RepID=A0ABN9CJ52_9NEOB|nr:unnamed protein product [Staurois parvus]